jgi:hypothetical protein
MGSVPSIGSKLPFVATIGAVIVPVNPGMERVPSSAPKWVV